MILYKRFVSERGIKFYRIELQFSILQWLGFHNKWFCRVWQKNWNKYSMGRKPFGQSYGKNKFEAFRLALKDLYGS